MEIIIRTVSIVIITVTISLLFKYLNSKTENVQITTDEKGMMVLKLNRLYGIVGWSSVLLSVGLLILGVFLIREIDGNFFAVVFLFLLFFGLGFPLVLAYRNIKIEVNNTTIKYFNLFNNVKEVNWNDLRQVKFGKSSLELKLITENTEVKAHLHLNGFPKLIEIMKENLDPSLYKDALSDIEIVKKRMGL